MSPNRGGGGKGWVWRDGASACVKREEIFQHGISEISDVVNNKIEGKYAL